MPEVTLRPAHQSDASRLVEVWRRAVEATHHFLSAADIDGYAERFAADFLPAVDLTVATVGGTVVGFSGTSGRRLEMLFVDPCMHGRGIGTQLLGHAGENDGIDEVDVNEQNPDAVSFYRNKGFEQVGRSSVDSEGRPFPLLHLRLRRTTVRS